MKDIIVSEWTESHFPLYQAGSIHSIYSTSNFPVYNINEGFTSVIAIAGGKGSLKLDKAWFALAEGNVIVLPADTEAVLIADPLHPLHVYKLVIGSRGQEQRLPSGTVTRTSRILSLSSVLFLASEPALVAAMEGLYIHRLPDTELRHVQNQLAFHQIILQLLEGQEIRSAAGEQPSMERSIAYLEQHYPKKITREQLAEIAGVSASHYSILFKQLTGFSPSEYLSRLRVHRAKELLIGGAVTLREIAHKVGYKDEFYLSRRFKQQTGAAPSGYNREAVQDVAVLLTPYASHLLLMGLEPRVIISDTSEYLNTFNPQPPLTMRFIDVNASAEEVKSFLLEHNIELIIAAGQHLHQYGLTMEQLRSAAPVAEIPWMEIGWKEHFRLIAQVIQRKERAEQWLAEFAQEEEAARSLLQKTTAAQEIITIFVMKPEGLFVYGARNVGCIIYQSLKLQPPARIRQWIAKLGDQFHSVPIQISELEEYAGDRILVIMFPDIKGSTAHTDAVFQSAEWRALPAVQHNYVHLLDHEDWIPYNPVSIRLQLQRAVHLFTSQ